MPTGRVLPERSLERYSLEADKFSFKFDIIDSPEAEEKRKGDFSFGTLNTMKKVKSFSSY